MSGQLFESLGFNKNPFSTFSAEEEADFLKDVFVEPLYFNSIKSEIKDGHTRFILGTRGIGKTALILRLKADCDKDKVFSVIIDDFDGVSIKKNKSQFIKTIIETITRDFCLLMGKNPNLVKKLSKVEKEKFAFIIKGFFKSLSQTEFEKYYDKATNYKTKNLFRNFYNNILNRPINFLISGGIEVVSDGVRKSLGLPEPNSNNFYKNYLPEIKIEEIEKDKGFSKLIEDSKALKGVLDDISSIIKKTGLGKPVIFFDKIDEYPILGSNIVNISDFLNDLLIDTSLLLNQNYALVFSVWDAIKPELSSRGVRFDKIKPLDITWSEEQLKTILNKRFSYFSENRTTHKSIIENEDDYNSIINLSSRSPRYLFRLFSVIYDEQFHIDPSAIFFGRQAIQNGQKIFSETFDFYAVFPGKRGTKEDIITNVNRLLRIGKQQIKTKDFVDIFKVHSNTGNSYIKILQDYGLISNTGLTDGMAKIFKIENPVILKLISHNIPEIKK